MESSGNAFNQVRAILGKLDRSIEEARSKRLGPTVNPRSNPEPEQTRPTSIPDPSNQSIGGGSSTTPPRRSEYGRAKPLRRDDAAPPTWPSSMGDEKQVG